MTINQFAGSVRNSDRDQVALRRATAGEKAGIVPLFATLPRLGRPPEVYVDTAAGEAAFVLGLLPDSRIRFHERDYVLELLLAAEPTAALEARIGAAIAGLGQDLGADHMMTAYLDAKSAECRLLRAIGFQVEARHHKLMLAGEGLRARFERWSRRAGSMSGGCVIVPYGAIDEKESRRLHEQVLGILPDGHYVLHGELESERDYRPSRAIILEGHCIGAIVGGIKGDEAQVESFALLPDHQGGMLAGRLLLAGWAGLAAARAPCFRFHVAESNPQTLRMVRSLGAEPAGEQLRLLWQRGVPA